MSELVTEHIQKRTGGSKTTTDENKITMTTLQKEMQELKQSLAEITHAQQQDDQTQQLDSNQNVTSFSTQPKQVRHDRHIYSPITTSEPSSIHTNLQELNNNRTQTILLPPPTTPPVFHGKPTERPRQFLIRVEEYTENVHMWGEDMLLRSISQFLKDDALEWYCQLRSYHYLPRTWAAFKETFISQFNSPIRIAQQQQQWIKCKQNNEETINEFVIRLRALWVEQFPQETESDLIKHLLCKMHPDILNIIGCPHGGNQHVYYKRPIPRQVNRTQQRNSEMKRSNQQTYLLCAAEQVTIPPYYAYNIRVKPTVPFATTENNDEEYELSTYIPENKDHQGTPHVANGILSPKKNLWIQTANFSKSTITILAGQRLAIISRMNLKQINAINHLTTTTNVQQTQNESNINDTINLSDTELSNDQKNQLQQLIKKYSDVFTDKPGKTMKLKHQINIKEGTRPLNAAPYRCAPSRRKIIGDNINEMLKAGIITPSNSPWSSPVVLAPKKDGTLRFCIDYRKLNAVTIRDAYPIPRIDDTLDALEEAKFISTLDLRSGYWQVEMDPKSQAMTAFISHKGLFEFKVMPYGLMNAPATFQRLMDIVLAGLKWQYCLVYIDDVIIYSSSFNQHIKDLTDVFEALRKANLTLKASKCYFCREEIKYLGHIITKDGVKPDPELISAVKEFPQPQKMKDIQAFLGLTGYYRRFIQNYAKITEPLLKQIRNNKNERHTNYHIKWNNECQQSFETLKQKLISSPIMNTPNFQHPFILELDACAYGLGAVLAQEYDGKKFVIAYASRTLSSTERNYSATEREALAIVWATKHFRPYIEGMEITIRTDCQALQWLKESKDLTGRLARWAMHLAAFQIKEIKYKPGATNTNSDPLSRYPLQEQTSSNSAEVSEIETMINIWENTNMLDDIREEQQKDKKLKPTIDKLLATSTPTFSSTRSPYVLVNGLLYKIRNGIKNQDHRIISNKHLLVIPTSMQDKLIAWAHDHPMAGHAGRTKTIHRLLSRVYWVSMRKDVYKYVQECTSCQQFKYNTQPLSMPMQLHMVTEPWHTIGIDLMGPFPTTQRQKHFLLVIVDYFTRWVELFPLRTTTADVIANVVINEVFCRYGMPTFMLSDNGPQFIAELFAETCKLLGIRRKLTANYHPQTNMTERVNRTLKQQIRIYAQQNHKAWDEEIQKLAFAIRTSVNETTGETPAFLNFGRDLKLPLDLIFGEPVQDTPTTLPSNKVIQHYKSNLIDNLKKAFNIAREYAEVQKWQQKNQYDRHTTDRQFEVGQLVWVTVPTGHISGQCVTNKMSAPFQGPCKIIEKISPSTFTVKRLSDNVNLGTVNADRMKPFYERTQNKQSDLESIQETEEHTNTTSTEHDLPAPTAVRSSSRTHRAPVRYGH
ncbi:unnamed protein product [Rotaria sordida]|uniref:Reverse transcriptase n=1 Tax=Rotaria sordida TaxID=392033 RepID=A0A819C6F5_9BILA|nr:unnamed protein product [Rotaria sordida]CAF3813473.1 unnamed protein product [Rotaria sordida]